jgi:hypothetical protein
MLLLIIMFSFGAIFAQAVHTHSMDHPEAATMDPNSLRFHFGSLSRSAFTLFKCVVGGLDWGEAAFVLSDVSPFLVALFIVYIVFVSLAVMNVVTGIFLQFALEQAAFDQDHMITQQLKEKDNYMANLTLLYHDLDSSRAGAITLADFEEHLGGEKLQAFLQSLDINTSDAWTFFKLLDVDGGGTLGLDEFVDGCMRLKGNAKSIHVAQILYENRWIMQKLSEVSNEVLDVPLAKPICLVPPKTPTTQGSRALESRLTSLLTPWPSAPQVSSWAQQKKSARGSYFTALTPIREP